MTELNKKSIIEPIPRAEAYQTIHAQASYYPRFIRIYIPDTPFNKLKQHLEAQDISVLAPSKGTYGDETNIERSLRRTRKSITDYVLCNNFSLFATFTFADDRDNVDRCKTRMSDWFHNQRKRKGKFEYLAVAEFHKDGLSLHFHVLMQDYQGEVRPSQYNGRLLKQKGRQVYELPGYTLGFTNAKKLDQNLDTPTKVSYYLQKYITKDMPIFFGKNRYRASLGLRKPEIEDNPETWYKAVEPSRKYQNEHGIFLEYDAGSHPLVDMFMKDKY